MTRSIYIGFDPTPSSALAFIVARASINRHLTQQIPVHGLILDDLRARGLYTRPTETRLNDECEPQIWDVISDAPCATEFSISRFLVPHLAKTGLALFMDCDMLARANFARLFDAAAAYANQQFAVMCVKHAHNPANAVKMDGKAQTKYARKNWSSFVLFNCDHPSNKKLTVEMVNTLPGRDLHRFCWLDDAEIGELPVEWNWLAGHSDPHVMPKVVHHTDGVPCLRGYEDAAFADEWRAELHRVVA